MSETRETEFILQEALRLSEGLIEAQFEEWERKRRGMADLMRLGVATLAGIVAAAGIAAGSGVALGLAGYAGATAAVALIFAGISILAWSSGAALEPQELARGSNPRSLLVLVQDKNPTRLQFLGSVLDSLAASYEANERAAIRASGSRGVGFWLVVAGAAVALVTIALIAGGLILR